MANKKVVESGWLQCDYCGGKGCRRCGNLGKVLRPGFKYCPSCDGFGMIGYDEDDPLDMGSFQEICPTCGGDGTLPDPTANVEFP